MKKKLYIAGLLLTATLSFAACGQKETGSTDSLSNNEMVSVEESDNLPTQEESLPAEDNLPAQEGNIDLEDGQYLVEFDTDSTMFHVNESMNGKALLTVENKKGNLHLVMPSKNVLNLYLGLAEDAVNDEANWINPSTENVTYSDGMTEEVNSFDVSVSVIGEEFDLAIIGKKEKWYDHKVKISNPEAATNETDEAQEENSDTEETTQQTIEVTLEGGSGKASITSPAKVIKTEDGYLVTIEWSSKFYDYMLVDQVKYEPVSVGETSVYEIPVKDLSQPLSVIADTIAMSTPHEIEYTITFLTDTLK